jgi:hypothetical protein
VYGAIGLGPSAPDAHQLMAALRQNQNQADIDQCLLTTMGMHPKEAFFNPANIQRILSTS